MTKKHTRYTIIASFFAMFIMAMTESARGILIPTFKSEFGVTSTEIGYFLVAVSLSFIVFTYFAGKYVKTHGQKTTIIMGMIIAGLGFLGTSFSQLFIHLTVGYIILTMGVSFIVMSLNTIVPLLKVSYIVVIMNSLHFFYGLGATVTQKITGYLITYGVSWRTIFIYFSGLYLLSIIVFLFAKQPPLAIEEKHKDKIQSFEIKLVILFSLALGFYISSEIQTANWLINYLKEVYTYTEDKGSFYLAFFFGALSIGRLFGGYVLEKIGYLKGVIISITIALTLYIFGLTSEKTMIYLSISGLFFSIVYPTSILIIQKFFKNNVTKVIAITTMSASGVSMILGWLVGYLNDNIGVVKSFLVIPISLFISLILMVLISFEIKHVENKRLES